MKLTDVQELTWDEINRMGKDDLKEAVQAASRVTKRRLNTLDKSGTYSPAASKLHDKIDKEPDLLTVRGKDSNELRHSLSAMQKFLNSKTGTYRGAVRQEKETLEKLLPRRKKETKKAYKERLKEAKTKIDIRDFWELYDKILELRPDLLYKADYGSDRIQQMLAEALWGDPMTEAEDVIKRMKEINEEITSGEIRTTAGGYQLPNQKERSVKHDGFFTRH